MSLKWKKSFSAAICLSFLVTLVVLFQNATTSSPLLWPMIDSGGGSYGTSEASEIDTLAGYGMRLDLMLNGFSFGTDALSTALKNTNSYYIDNHIVGIWELDLCGGIIEACAYDSTQCNVNSNECPYDQTKTAKVLADVQAYLQTVARNPYLVGFYVLDDAPTATVNGTKFRVNIKGLLQQIHGLVAQANIRSVFARPMICGFAGAVEFTSANTSYQYHPHGTNVTNFTENAVNFSPTGCDVVSLYSYGVTTKLPPSGINVASLLDWTMSDVLPYQLAALKNVGWDITQTPLMAFPQAFGTPPPKTAGSLYYIEPRQQDVTTQMEAFCKAGVTSVLPFAWNTVGTHDPSLATAYEPYNTPALATGVVNGFQACQGIWNARPNAPQYAAARVQLIQQAKTKMFQSILTLVNAAQD